jgi:hypothetical protein
MSFDPSWGLATSVIFVSDIMQIMGMISVTQLKCIQGKE